MFFESCAVRREKDVDFACRKLKNKKEILKNFSKNLKKFFKKKEEKRGFFKKV